MTHRSVRDSSLERLPFSALRAFAWTVALGALVAGRWFDPDLRYAPSLAANAALTSILLAAIAVAAVANAREGILHRLGLASGRLPWCRAGWLTLGLLGLSRCLDHAISAIGVARGPVIDGLVAAAQQSGAAGLGLLFLGVALAPAIAEEVFARGWIQRGLASRIGVAPAIAASALLFGALHGHPVHATAAAALGLWLGWIVHVDGGLRVAIVAHGLNNAIAILSAALMTPSVPDTNAWAGMSCDASWARVSIALSVLALVLATSLELRAVRTGRVVDPPSGAPGPDDS